VRPVTIHLLLWALLSGLFASAREPQIAIVGGHLFDSLAGERVRNPGVLVRSGKIVAVGHVPGEGERTIELTGEQTLLPGFIDLHAHFAVDLFGRGRVDETLVTPVLFLANGVTTTFTAGEVDPQDMLELRRSIDRGEAIGPRILNSGPYFGRWRRGWDDQMSTESLRREVDYWAERGVRHFKAKGLRAAYLEALIDQAHRHGATVTGHLGSGYRGSVNPSIAIDMGIDRVEHFLGGSTLPPGRSAYRSLATVDVASEGFRAICRQFIDQRIYFDPTMSAFGYFGAQDPQVFFGAEREQRFFTPYVREFAAAREHEPQELFETLYWKKRETLRAFYQAGGGPFITVGTDHPSWGQFLAAFGYHRELQCLAESGIPLADVLKCATINGARALQMEGQLGSIEVGKLADLVVVQGDPLTDIRATRSARLVIKAGRIYDPKELFASVEGRLGPHAEDEAAKWKPNDR